jgi:uncharacterized protein (DUF983 family)
MADVADGGGESVIGSSSRRSSPVAPVRPLTAVFRGFLKRCPNCGRGRIYTGWAKEVKTCPVCGLVYEPTEGDTWAFTIIGDRIPVAAGIIVVYFEFGSRLGPTALVAVMAVLCAVLLWTAPNRWGVGVALLYLQRVWWPDPLDRIPHWQDGRDRQDGQDGQA